MGTEMGLPAGGPRQPQTHVTSSSILRSDASLYCDDVDIRFSKTMNSCKVLQIRYASVERLLERLTDLRFLSIDFLNTFLHSYRVFTTAVVVLDKLITIYKKPISAIPARSLELLFASGQNNKLLYGEPPKSPRATRKFSSPPPLSISTSSPSRRRKLSLNIPIITGGKALDLAALSCSSNGYTSMYSAMSPFSKATLDTNKLYVSSSFANKIPDEGDTTPEKPEDPSALSKQSSEVSVKEESDVDQNQSDDGDTETSPTKSPTTPKSVKSKNSSEFPLFSYNNGVVMTSCRELDNNRSALSAASAFAIATAGANEGTPNKEKYRRMSLASAGFPPDQRNGDKEFVIRRAATNRVLNVLRHWVSKHSQDFETNDELKCKVIGFLEEVMHDPELLTQERKAAANIIRLPRGQGGEEGPYQAKGWPQEGFPHLQYLPPCACECAHTRTPARSQLHAFRVSLTVLPRKYAASPITLTKAIWELALNTFISGCSGRLGVEQPALGKQPALSAPTVGPLTTGPQNVAPSPVTRYFGLTLRAPLTSHHHLVPTLLSSVICLCPHFPPAQSPSGPWTTMLPPPIL
ncbi:Hypothetical predicted protein [Marmota monax]|uniref:N-terminal Ras-GEF domain-containing protein n=1 Tax=Marmota monax TaxID=9995 RepID=A0A5E4AWX5_MARMO|nr:Hypothetical predicted protein [Marmota monax]